MLRLISAVRSAIETQNWYSALLVSLSLPDICGRIEEPSKGGRERYEHFFNRYLAQFYTGPPGHTGAPHTFLSGSDCYALRCSYIHEGRDDITTQKARQTLERFRFSAPDSGIVLHCIQMGNVLQLQVDIFCEHVCQAVEVWLKDVSGDAEVEQRMKTLLTVYPTANLPGFSRTRKV